MISPQELIERITQAATYSDCLVIVSEKSQANLRWANSTLTTNGVIAERTVTVIAFLEVDGGIASGVVTRTDVQEFEIESIVKEAESSARAAGKAIDAAPLAKDFSRGAWQTEHHATGPAVFSQIAPELGEMFKRSQSDQIELFGYAEHTHRSSWLGSKGGLRLRWDHPAGRIEMTGKSHQRSRSTWHGLATQDFSNIAIPEIDSAIRQRLQWQGKRIDIPAGRYDTLMPSGGVADLFTYLLWSAGGREAFEGRSVFSRRESNGAKTRIGERLSNQNVNLFSEPNQSGLNSIPFVLAPASGPMSSVFDNGQLQQRTDWLKEGRLNALVQTRASAQETDLAFTPMGENLILEVPGATGSLTDLTSEVKDGLLLTTLWYIREVDPSTLLLTGLTRDGVYRIKDGEVIGAVNNFRWNESPVDLLSRIAKVGGTEITQPREWGDYVDRSAMPPMIFEKFNMSTVSLGN